MTMLSEMAEQAEVIRRVMAVNDDRIGRFGEQAGGDVSHRVPLLRTPAAHRRVVSCVPRTRRDCPTGCGEPPATSSSAGACWR